MLQAPIKETIQPLCIEPAEILIVDDEPAILRLIHHFLQQHGYRCTLAHNSREARECMLEKDFALLLCDINMPGESGLDLVRTVLAESPATAAIMITGLDSPLLANAALEAGTYGYIIKPFESNEIIISVANALRRRRLEMENRRNRIKLEDIIHVRTQALEQTLDWLGTSEKELRLSREETIQRLALAAEYRDKSTACHIQRMSHYCALLARKFGLDEARIELIRTASPMHDIGKIGTPDHVLLKPGKFTDEEYEVITQHAEIGYRILSGSEAELLKVAAIIAYTHHERYDGLGYPRGLKGKEIPLEGRIASIADTFDALTSKRVYKPAFTIEEAFQVMQDHHQSYFDPELLRLFFESAEEIRIIHDRYQDE